ncbi:MAG: helix-turn-helix transcriptional regulator [Chitinophagaceae bacterium]
MDEDASGLDYALLDNHVRLLDKVACLTYQSVYIIDYYRRSFAYVSNNPLFLCGLKAKEVEWLGYAFYLKFVPLEDLELLLAINEAGFHFFGTIPLGKRMDYNISYDFRMKQPKSGHTLLVNHKLTPLELDKSGNMWLALCVVSTSSNDSSGNIFIRERGNKSVFKYDMATRRWLSQDNLKLTTMEKEILLLSIQGPTSGEIARQLSLSVNTIKYHRKRILKKMDVSNMAEALAYASNSKLI